jgi:HAMP domain-containing protein
MMTGKTGVSITKVHYGAAVLVLVVSLLSSVISLGYNIRRVVEIDNRVCSLESKGSVEAQLSTKDIQWLKESIKEIKDRLERFERKLDSHITK